MFVRIKSSPNSPRKSVQICESRREGAKVRQIVIRHVGVAADETGIKELARLARYFIDKLKEDDDLPFFPKVDSSSNSVVESSNEPSSLPQPLIVQPILPVDLAMLREKRRLIEGFHDVFGKLFVELGFHRILSKKPTETLLHVLMARIAKPASKRCTQEFLNADFGREIDLERIYHMLDLLILQKEKIQQQVYQATCSLGEGHVDVLFFDVTTLYFESVEQDELRNFGYSKDQKFHSTQVVLALATNADGLPVGYQLFPGNTADVSTLLKCLEEWKKNLTIGQIVIVADRAMMSESNLTALEADSAGIKYVIAAKLRKSSKDIREKILKNEGQWIEFQEEQHCKQEFMLPSKRKLIVTYSKKRAKKDREDRQRIIEKIQKTIGNAKNPKKLITNRGYVKYLKANGKVDIKINEEKIAEEEAWDGFHGIITNDLETKPEELLARYRRLWVIEESFRIHKHNLAVRPIFHYKPRRIEAHILLCYMAFCLIRHAQYRLRVHQKEVSLDEIRRELQRVQASTLEDEATGKRYRIPSSISSIAKIIYQVMGVKRELIPSKM